MAVIIYSQTSYTLLSNFITFLITSIYVVFQMIQKLIYIYVCMLPQKSEQSVVGKLWKKKGLVLWSVSQDLKYPLRINRNF